MPESLDLQNEPNREDWSRAISEMFRPPIPQSAQWSDPSSIVQVLAPFMGRGLNHTMLPGGGGNDMESIAEAREPGCLMLCMGPGSAEIFRPATLYFEHFEESPWNSFFLLETEALSPSGVDRGTDGMSETLVEVSPGEYIDRDQCILGYDEEGEEIPLPETVRIVTRYMRGKFLVVAKASLWNLLEATYDGRHNGMTAQQIRTQIQDAINRMTIGSR